MEDNPSPFTSSSNFKENDENLEEFRRRWRQELEQKKPSQQQVASSSTT
ncbi:676_t:CDS:1, partial [Acaulospora morrowiae]